MKYFFPKIYLFPLLLFCFFILACPMPHPLSGELEVVKTENVELESGKFENDTAVINSDSYVFKFQGNWNHEYSPALLISISISNKSMNSLILKFSEVRLKDFDGEISSIGDITKKEKDGSDTWLRNARKEEKENTDIPEDVKLAPKSENELDIVFKTNATLNEGDSKKFFYLKLPIEFENVTDSKKDLQVTFKAVENK